MIIYLLAIASPTHAVPGSLYYSGWESQSDTAVGYRQGWGRTMQGDPYTNGNMYYGHKLDVGVGNGGELFFTQYSFMAFDSRGKRDRYTNYFQNNRNIALISHDYSVENPRHFRGYGDNAWGRSAGVNTRAAARRQRHAHLHRGTGLFFVLPRSRRKAMGQLRISRWLQRMENWFEDVNMALNQAPIVVMIEIIARD